jgi:primosomal protein N'
MDALITARYAEVAVDGTLPSGDSPTLTYLVPSDCPGATQPGALVWVPLRKKAALGVVMALHDEEPAFEVKPIYGVAPGDRLVQDQLEFGRWLSHETAASLFGCLSLMLPPGVSHSVTPWFEIKNRAPGKTKMQERVLALLRVNGAMSLDQLQKELESPLTSVLPDLERAGQVSRRYQSEARTTRQRMERWWIAAPAADPAKLTGRQRDLFDVVVGAGAAGIRAGEAADRTGVSAPVA